MRKKPLLLIVALTSLLVACGGGEEPALTASTPDITDDKTFRIVTPENTDDTEMALPTHLMEEPIIIAIMLPMTGDNAVLGDAMLNAASMALVDAYDHRLTLVPFDTKGTYAGAEEAALDIVMSDADIVLGPIFSSSIEAAAPIINDAGLTLIGFSSDTKVAGIGHYTMGFSLEDEVNTVVRHAVEAGHQQFGALIPEGVYGNRVFNELGDLVESENFEISAIESYPPDATLVFEPTERLANYKARKRAMDQEIAALKAVDTDMTDDIVDQLEKQEVIGDPDFTAVLIPEGGDLLRTIAPLLPFYEVDPAKVQFLGTGLWNDPGLTKEPPLYGAWFAAPDPSAPNDFFARYRNTFNKPAPRIATLAYDAMAMVASLARIPVAEDRFSTASILDERGFNGIDGIFRFHVTGVAERGLAILEINRNGFEVVKKAPKAFALY